MSTAITARRSGRATALLAIALAMACGGGGGKKETGNPATPQSVTDQVGANGAALAAGYLAALETLQGSSATGAVADGLAPLQEAMGALLGGSVSLPTGLALPAFPAEEFSRYLTGRVFTAANVESSDGTSVTYRLPASAVCPYDLADGSHALAPVGGSRLSPTCVALIDGIGLRIRATQPSDSRVDFAFLLGDSRASPLTVRLGPDSADFVVDLAGAAQLLGELLAGSGATLEVAMSGTVDLRIQVNRRAGSRSDVTFSAAIASPLSARLASQGEEITFGSEARSPVFSLRVDGIDGVVEVVANLGVTTLGMPYDDGSGTSTGRATEVTLGGLRFTTRLQEGQADEFVVGGFGFGDVQSRVTIGGERYLSLDLAPRQVDLTFRRDPLFAGRTIFGIDSGARVTVYADTRLVGGVDPSFAGKSYDFRVSASAGRPELEPYLSGGSLVLKVVRGTFTLDDGTDHLDVSAGQCLLRLPWAVTQSWVDDYQAGTCP